MNDLIRVEESLPPATIEELQEWIIITKERLNAHKAKIRAIEKVGAALAAKEAALADGQRLADLLLDAEVRLGEMLESRPDRSYHQGTSGKMEGKGPLPPGITKKQSHQAQELASHKDIVDEVKNQARKEGTIPTSRQVHAKIKEKKEPSDHSKQVIKTNYGNAYKAFQTALLDMRKMNWQIITQEEALHDLGNLEDIIIND